MSIQKLILHHFRNYVEQEIEFSEGVNVLIGDNGQGKTNMLEAIHYCSTGRSHRTSYDRECIYLGENDAFIQVICKDPHVDFQDKIEIHLRKNGKKSVIINQMPLEKISDLFGCVYTVLFSPEELSLIQDGPAVRRRFMDMEICQVDKIYLYHVQQYQSVLRQRNELLKKMDKLHPDEGLLDIYDIQLAEEGVHLIARRREFIDHLQKIAPALHERISGGKEQITFAYDASVMEDTEVFLKTLKEHRIQDYRTSTTNVGPHRDDIMIRINGLPARIYGSQGQQRTAALSMKLSQMQMMEEETGCKPVLLLDDVMSELDESRQMLLVQCIERHQTIITCTGVEDSIRKLQNAKVFHVRTGKIVTAPGREIGERETV